MRNRIISSVLLLGVLVVTDACLDERPPTGVDERAIPSPGFDVVGPLTPPTVLWDVIFTAGHTDTGEGVAVGPDGHPIVTINSSVEPGTGRCGFRTIKYDAATGTELWHSVFATSGLSQCSKDVAIGDDGNPVVTGYGSRGHPLGSLLRTIKYDGHTGAILWNQTFDAGLRGRNEGVEGWGVAVDAVGDVFVTGRVVRGGDLLLLVMKSDGATGTILWTVMSADARRGHGVAVGTDGHPVVAAYGRTTKYHGETGAMLWWAGFDGDGRGVAVDAANNPVVTGNGVSGAVIRKYDGATGGVLWDTALSNYSRAFGVAVGPDGHPVNAGSGYMQRHMFRTSKVDGATGTVLWTVLDAAGIRARAVAVGADGSVVVTGYVRIGGTARPAALTIKYVPSNRAPVANAGPDQTVECAGPGTNVVLDASGSSDPDGDALTYSWSAPVTFDDPTSAAPAAACPLGPTIATLTVTDPSGLSDTDEVEIRVEDTTPPTLTVSATPDHLWPPNHKYVPIDLSVVVEEYCDASPTVTAVAVSNEPDNEIGDGNTVGDIKVIQADGTVLLSSNEQPAVGFNPLTDQLELLAAERAGTGDGRVYTIAVTAIDASGNQTSALATVTVAHDQRK